MSQRKEVAYQSAMYGVSYLRMGVMILENNQAGPRPALQMS